jgi:hypothetical protein
MRRPHKLWLRTVVLTSVLFALSTGRHESAIAQSDPPADTFSESIASKLLSEVTEGLQAHLPRRMLGVFDLNRMNRGAIFKEQVTAFFNQYDSIRVHFKLVEVKDNTVTVNAQMEASAPNAITPPQHKSTQLRFTIQKTSSGWKFVDVQPRSFFS